MYSPLKNEIYKYMTSVSKNVHIDKLDKIINKYSKTYHRTIKITPVDVNPITYTDFNKENNKEGRKFKVRDHVRISKHKNLFANGYVPNWSEEVFVITKVLLLLFRGHMLLVILKGKKFFQCFTKRNCKKQIKKSLELKN